MAQLHEVSEAESDGEFPDLPSLLQNVKINDDASQRERVSGASPKRQSGASGTLGFVKPTKAVGHTPQTSTVIYKPHHGNSSQLSRGYKSLSTVQLTPPKPVDTKRSPQKTHQRIQSKEYSVRKFIKSGYRSYDESEVSYDSDTSLSGFIVNDSASEEERTPEKSALTFPKELSGQNAKSANGEEVLRDDDISVLPSLKTPRRLISRRERDLLKSTKTAKKTREPKVIIDLISPIKPNLTRLSSGTKSSENQTKDELPRSETESFGGDNFSQQEFSLVKDSSATDSSLLENSPRNSRSPRKMEPIAPNLVPQTPSKSKLLSPTKRPRVPLSPHRPSIDAFWSQDVINEWNDEYSPLKASPVRRLFQAPDTNSRSISPPPSPCKIPAKTPAKTPKKDRATILARKEFDSTKEHLASSFLAELDEKITGSQVSALTATTGGIKILWSKKLTTTAGRASWKREAIRSRPTIPSNTSVEPVLIADSPSKPTNSTAYIHYATIELSTKVLTTAERLHNTLAHEYCHLANFIISNQRSQPHGPSFRAWAKKASRTFEDRGVVVTTTHDYKIEWKYVWECEACGRDYGRHSRSIDTTRMRCGGGCGGQLVQIKPVPRGRGEVKEGLGGDGGVEQGFQAFVKERYKDVKMEMQGKGEKVGMGDVMVVLGREWRKRGEVKESRKQSVELATLGEKEDVIVLEEELEVLALD